MTISFCHYLFRFYVFFTLSYLNQLSFLQSDNVLISISFFTCSFSVFFTLSYLRGNYLSCKETISFCHYLFSFEKSLPYVAPSWQNQLLLISIQWFLLTLLLLLEAIQQQNTALTDKDSICKYRMKKQILNKHISLVYI